MPTNDSRQTQYATLLTGAIILVGLSTFVGCNSPSNRSDGSDSIGDGPGIDYNQNFYTTVIGDSPLGFWRLQESGGVHVYDSSGNNFIGTYASAVQFGEAGPMYETSPPSAVGFGGTNSYALFPNSFQLDPSDPVSLEVWLMIPSANLSGTNTLVNMGSQTGSNQFLIQYNASQQTITWKYGLGTLTTSYLPYLDQWTQVDVTYDGTNQDLFLGGNLVATLPLSNPPTNILTSGRLGDISSVSTIQFAEVSAYNYALSTEQVSNHSQGAGY